MVAHTAKKKRRGRPQLAMVDYVVQITDWDWSYSFGLNSAPHDNRRYNDYRHLLIRGRLLLPTPLMLKAEIAELTFLPDVRPEDIEPRGEHQPRAVGHLNINRGMLTGGLSMATEALDSVMRLLLAGRLNYLELHGEPMRYRHALIRSYQLAKQLNPDDYPDG